MSQSHSKTPPTPTLEQLVLKIPRSIGSVSSLCVHTLLFVGIFSLRWFHFDFNQILLILTTIVSLEAIYLSVFIQMTVNHQAKQIEEVSDDVEELSENIEDISEDVDEISKDIDTIQEEVKEISDDVEDLGEEIEQDDKEDSEERKQDIRRLEHLELVLKQLLQEVKDMKK
ncbi:MAG: coiled-coil domain-containing protein [Minisyncoccota bacterium]